MATARPVRAMDPYAEQFWAFTLDRELRLQQCSGPDLRPLPARRFRVVRAQRYGEGALPDDVPAGYFAEYPPPPTVVAVELAEGPLFISWPVDIAPSDLREGMTLELRWTDAADRFSEYTLPVVGPPSAPGPTYRSLYSCARLRGALSCDPTMGTEASDVRALRELLGHAAKRPQSGPSPSYEPGRLQPRS